MAQISYGTITITDTNDIEKIYMEYAQSTSNQTAPTTGWDDDIPTWRQGYYIWQRTVTKMSGVPLSSDSYGEPVCLTGSTGSTGAPGQSVDSIVTTYCNYGSGTPAESYSGWQSTVPAYDSTKPNYWVKTVITYSNPTDTSVIIYKDNGITSATSTAAAAWSKADQAQTDAGNALSQATAANNATALLGGHFIYKSTTSVTGLTPPSANVVENIEATISGVVTDVTDKPAYWGYNTHIGANGIKLRHNETDLICLNKNGLNIYNKDGESVAIYGDESRIGKEDGAAFCINDNSLLGFYMKPTGIDEYQRIQYFTVNSNGIFYGADSDDTRTITRGELNGELQSITTKLENNNNDMQANIKSIQSNLDSINSDLYDNAPALSAIKNATNMVNNYLGNGKVLNWNDSNSTLQLTNTIFSIQMLSDRIVFQKNNQTAAAIRDDISFHINDAVINNTERLGTNFQWVVGTNRLTLMRI